MLLVAGNNEPPSITWEEEKASQMSEDEPMSDSDDLVEFGDMDGDEAYVPDAYDFD